MELFRSSDIYLIAYLSSKDHEIVSIEKKDKCTFLFRDSEDIKNDMMDYYNEKGNIQPLKYANNIKKIKSMTFNS